MNIRTKPWYLRALTPAWAWVAWREIIYIPAGVNPYDRPELIAHESVHLQQQGNHPWRWLWKYVTNSCFRLDQEAPAIAKEIGALPLALRKDRLNYYCAVMSTDGGTYDPPFGDPLSITYHEAKMAILSWMEVPIEPV
jgi:hypothetical protein